MSGLYETNEGCGPHSFVVAFSIGPGLEEAQQMSVYLARSVMASTAEWYSNVSPSAGIVKSCASSRQGVCHTPPSRLINLMSTSSAMGEMNCKLGQLGQPIEVHTSAADVLENSWLI